MEDMKEMLRNTKLKMKVNFRPWKDLAWDLAWGSLVQIAAGVINMYTSKQIATYVLKPSWLSKLSHGDVLFLGAYMQHI